MSDDELLRAFVRDRDERAFRQIVERYLGAVYAAARRQLGRGGGGGGGGDAHLADDVTQAVFIMLARKAPRLRDGTLLAGWLVNAARFTARTAARSESRRKRHVQRMADMTPRTPHPSAAGDDDDTDGGFPNAGTSCGIDLEEAALDDALARLSASDRTVLTLRFLQDKSVREVAAMLGISEAATAKRASRALERLRGAVRQTCGRGVAPAVLAAALAAQAKVTPPAALTADLAADAALAPAAAGGVAADLAGATLGRLSLRTAVWGATAATALLLLLSSALLLLLVARHRSIAPPAAATAKPASAATATAALRVGVYVSANTGVQALKYDKDRHSMTRGLVILGELRAPDIELLPLIEPGSDQDPAFAALLAKHFPGKRPLHVTDVDALLSGTDVLVASAVCYPREDALAAIETAVGCGRGLMVRQCLGGDHFGYAKPTVRRLRVFEDAEPDAVAPTKYGDSEIAADHELLGDLAGRVGETVNLRAYGAYGKLVAGAVPLLRMTTYDSVRFERAGPIRPRPGYAVYPLAAGMLGKGRIVSCAFGYKRVPPVLDAATGGEFTVRAVRWLAGRPVKAPA